MSELFTKDPIVVLSKTTHTILTYESAADLAAGHMHSLVNARRVELITSVHAHAWLPSQIHALKDYVDRVLVERVKERILK